MLPPLGRVTAALVDDFLQRRGFWNPIAESTEHLLSYLTGIERQGEPVAALLLWPGLERRSAQVRHRALEVMTALLAKAEGTTIRDLIREAAKPGLLPWPKEAREQWWQLTPAAVQEMAAARPASTGLLVLLSGHPNGYVRQAAVQGLDGITNPCVLPALRERLNDWVEPVRRAAFRAMRSFLSVDHAAALVASLELFDELRRCGRADHQPLLDQVEMVLREPAARAMVEAGLHSSVPIIRRTCYAILLQVVQPIDALVAHGMTTSDAWMHLHAARTVRSLPPGPLPTGSLDQISASPYGTVRQIGVELVAATGDVVRLRGFLLDRAPMVREFARYYLGKSLADFSAANFYRQYVGSVGLEHLSECLAGLGECGDDNDLALIIAKVSHQRVAVRLAALRALARLAPESLVDPFLAALADSSGNIRRIATAALSRRRSPDLLARLKSWAVTAGPTGRRCVVLLLSEYNSREQLPALLPFLTDAEEGVRSLAENCCLRTLAGLRNPFLDPDPWQVWTAANGHAWSEAFQFRVRALFMAPSRRR